MAETKQDFHNDIAHIKFKKASKGKSRDGSDGVFTVGYGSGGIEEMSTYLPQNDDLVLFALVDFKIGSGTFARMKNISMHFNGENTKNILKGRINAERKKVEKVIGPVNGGFQICHQSECHVDTVLEKVVKYFSADHSDGEEPTLAQYKEMYEEQVKVDQAKQVADTTRKTARDFERTFTSEEILGYLHSSNGPFNWALFKPNKKSMRTAEINQASLSQVATFVNAGSLSINEMLRDIKDKDVLGGIVRMGFGSGTFRRTKHIALWWSGDKVGAVERGARNAKKKRLAELLKPWAFNYTAQRKSDLTINHLIDIVHQKLAVDGDTDSAHDPFSEEAFYAALGEEIKQSADFFGDDNNSARKKKVLSPEEAVKKLKDGNVGINWVLLGLKK